jgi:hypothetical protein
MGHRRTDLTTVRFSRFGSWESQWVSRTNYNSLLFQDFQINRYILGIFYKLRYPTSDIIIKRFSTNLIVIGTTVYVSMATNIGLLFFNSDFLASIGLYLYRLVKLYTFIARASRTAGIGIKSTRAEHVTYLYNIGLSNSISYKYRMQLYQLQYILLRNQTYRVLISTILATVCRRGGVVSNAIFFGYLLQFIILCIATKINSSINFFQHFFSYFAFVLRVAYSHKTFSNFRILNIDYLENAQEARKIAHTEINIPTTKAGNNIFVERTRLHLQQNICDVRVSFLNSIQACYSRLSFLYYRYVGLINSSERILFVLVQIRTAISRIDKVMRFMRRHIDRVSTKLVTNVNVSTARKNAMYGGFFYFTKFADIVRLGHIYPVNKARLLFLSNDAQSTFEKNVYVPLFRIHAHILRTLYRVAMKKKITAWSYSAADATINPLVASSFVPRKFNDFLRVGTVIMRLSPIIHVTIGRRIRRILRSARIFHILAEVDHLLALSPTLNVNKYVAVLFKTYVSFISNAIKRLPKKYIIRNLKKVVRWHRRHLRNLIVSMSYPVRTTYGMGIFRVRNKLVQVRKLYKSVKQFERRVMRMRKRLKHLLLNALSEYGLVHPPLVGVMLAKRNVLMVLAGQLMRLTMGLDLRLLDNMIISVRKKKIANRRNYNSRKYRQRKKAQGILGHILAVLQQAASRAVSVQTMYNGLCRIQNYIAVLKARIRHSIIQYSRVVLENINRMGIFESDIERALASLKKENSLALSIKQEGAIHSIVRAYTNYFFYRSLINVSMLRLIAITSKPQYEKLPGTIKTTIFKPIYNLAHSNLRTLVFATTNISVELFFILSKLRALLAFTAKITHRVLLSRIILKMSTETIIIYMRQFFHIYYNFVVYTSKLQNIQQFIYINKVRMRYATILRQTGFALYIRRLGRFFISKQKMLYCGERWLFVKLGRVCQILMQKWFIDTLTVFNLYMEDTLSRYLNMRVLLLLDFFRERSKRRNPRIFIDRVGKRAQQQPSSYTRRRDKFPPMNNAKILCEYIRNRIERGAYVKRIFKDVRYWQRLELRKMNRLQHKYPKIFYRIEKKYPFDGIRILVSGPQKKARRKQRIYYHLWVREHEYSRRMPLQTVNKNIEYHKLHARRRASVVGVKVWLALKAISTKIV